MVLSPLLPQTKLNLQMHEKPSPNLDDAIIRFDTVLRKLAGRRSTIARRESPAVAVPSDPLSPEARWTSRRLMRVNHSGEVCAQALYEGQACAVSNDTRRAALRAAAAEEFDHLAWCARRLRELETHPSYLNPLWYAGAFVMGAAAGRIGDRFSMAFLAETERQVVAHLEGHLARLPPEDHASRAILTQMKIDETKHLATARRHGAFEFPGIVKWIMRAQAKIMITVAAEV